MTTQRSGIETNLVSLPAFKLRPRPARYGPHWSAALLAADALILVASVWLAQFLTHSSFAELAKRDGALGAVVFAALVWMLLFERIGMYRRSLSAHARDEVYAALAASAMAMLPALAAFLLLPELVPFRHLLVTTLVIAAVGVSFVRSAAHALRWTVFPPTARRIAVVGSPARVAAVPSELSLTAADRIIQLPREDFDDAVAAVVASGRLDDLDWLSAACVRGCDELIVTEALPPELMPSLLRYTEGKGIKIAFAPMRIRPHACDFEVRRDGGLALLYPRSLAICTRGADLLRRTLDIAIALPALALLSPLLAAIAAAIVLGDGRPILYRQIRVGRYGATFTILKFRTMRTDAESVTGPIWAQNGEARTTPVGRFLRRTSLDELPQLLNVLRGDMSIVGPRPERPYYVEQFRKLFSRYDERHLVRPGITGWSHIHMRRNVEASAIGERLGYDLFYLEHWSIFMDLLIIAKTAAEFLFHSAV